MQKDTYYDSNHCTKTDNPIKTNPIPIRSLSNDDINVGITEPWNLSNPCEADWLTSVIKEINKIGTMVMTKKHFQYVKI